MRAYSLIRTRRDSDRIVHAALSTRRALLRTAFGAGVIAGTAAALAPILGKKASAGQARASAPSVPASARSVRTSAGPVRAAAQPAERFAETYRGRRIEAVVPSRPVTLARDGRTPAHPEALAPAPPEVFIDGRPLHVMRCANGGYLSVVNHYESFPTLLAVARAAVDDLGPAQLSRTLTHSV